MTAPAMKSSPMDHLAHRVRVLLDGDPRITEKTMFGGLTFLLNGRILVAGSLSAAGRMAVSC